ncbi:MAG: hypothetical protein NC212_07125 [Staphylococcus sp.]|nr:hypothetical protein [Staphylococcus sp.]
MRQILVIFITLAVVMPIGAKKYSYTFKDTPVSQALIRLGHDHPDISIAFIYKELDNYQTSAHIDTDDLYCALRRIIGFNPISVTRNKNSFYIEALQHGKFIYNGQVVGTDHEPVAAATVLLLTPRDSTVITYGITDGNGSFSIPCDRKDVLAKISCIGYQTTYHRCNSYNVGTVIVSEQAIKLNEVKVEAENARLLTDRSVYIPTQRHKNASQSGADLLAHMAIPQLDAITGGSIKTNTGKPVAAFIDYIPASENDLKAMRIADVKRVEFYQYPSDPRLQGEPYAVNFIMQQYEYGGYIKGFSHVNLISFSEQLLGNMKLQYKKMTYDIMGYGFNMNNSHYGSNLRETFRLPKEDGGEQTFDRTSKTLSSKTENQQYFAALRASYHSDKIQASSQFNASVNTVPHSDSNGIVTYDTEQFATSNYDSTSDKNSRFLAYSGYYFFVLPRENTLSFTPSYVFTHSETNSAYIEEGFSKIINSADDNTSQIKGSLKFSHNFGQYGNLIAYMNGNHEYNRTRYYGSASSFDRIKSSRLGLGISYSINTNNLYATLGFGYDWDRLEFSETVEKPSRPSFDISLQYTLRKKHSFTADFHYSTKQPLPSFKSENVITSSPFLKYTGNPHLIPLKSYDFNLNYTWIPSNNFSFSAFASGWFVGDRYAFNYEATPDGILRTISQPAGVYAQGRYGIKGTARFLNRSLAFTASVAQVLNHNGRPYDINHSCIYGYAQARYYLGNWNFALTYISESGGPDGSVNGIWTQKKSEWYVAIGWSNSDWNVKANIVNFTRWNWRSEIQEMQSKWYDTREQLYNGHSHALVQISATYTFGFGKKVKRGDEPSISNSSSSGILQ